MHNSNRRALLAAVTLTALLAAGPGQAEMTVGEMLDGYRNTTGAERETYVSAAINVHIGLGWADSYIKRQHPDDQFACPPPNTTLDGEDVLKLLDKFAYDNPDIRKQPYGMGILFADMAAFPCHRGGYGRP